MGTQDRIDLGQGFSHGNYAQAYETRCLADMLEAIPAGKSETYRQAAVLGFYSSHELSDIPIEDRDIFDDAYNSEVGRACCAAGYCADRSQEYKAEQDGGSRK